MIKKNAISQFYRVFEIFAKNYKPIPLEAFTEPYEALVSALLSSRTNDDTTHPAAKRLFKTAPDVNSLEQLGQLKIRNLIYPVGFYKTKAKNLKKMAGIISEVHEGRIPDTLEALTTLPGVGRKTANIVLVRSFGKDAISVDTHVHRISNALGWVNTKTPEQTERELMRILPKSHWRDVNRLFVSIGRQHRTQKKLEEFLRRNGL